MGQIRFEPGGGVTARSSILLPSVEGVCWQHLH